MAKTIGVWGIDLGQCALKAIRLEMQNGVPTATAFDYIEHPKILSQPDADPDALTREALEKFLSRNPIGKDQVAISVPGQSGLARFVKLPPVEEKKVLDIVKFEAKQQIPFPLEEVVWDYQKLSDKVEVVGGFAMETEIGLFAMKRDIINRYLGHYNGVKTEVHVVQMAPLGLTNYATYELLKKRGSDTPPEEAEADLPPGKKKRCVVILDIGTDASNLIITDGAKIIWQRPVPLGGSNFTRVLTKEMKLTFAKAEHLKRNAAKSPDLAQILKSLRPVLTDFVGEVQRSLGYFTNTHRDAHVAYLVGLGSAFKLPGLQKYLAEKLSLEVRKPSTIDGIAGDAVLNDPVFQENVLTFPVAYGLALQGLSALQLSQDDKKKYALLRTNLLPQEIHTERLIRAKKPWAAASAACLLLGVGAVAFGYGAQYRNISDPIVDKAMAKGKSTYSAGTSQNSEYKKADADVQVAMGNVNAIVAGNQERLNWIRLNEVVSSSLPRPPLVQEYKDETKIGTKDEEILKEFKYVLGADGQPLDPGNLVLPARNVGPDGKSESGKEPWRSQMSYVNSEPALRSIQKYSSRVRFGVTTEKLYESPLVAYLPQVNIEAIDCRFCDNLQQFLDNAADNAKKEYGIHIVADLMDPRSIQIKSPKGDEETITLEGEREAASEPKVKATGGDGRYNFNPVSKATAGWVVEVRGYTYHTDGYLFVRHTLVRNLQELNEFARAENQHEKVLKYIKSAKDPVLGKVSHAFLGAYKTTTEEDLAKDPKGATTPPFQLLNSGLLDRLVAAPAATAGGGTGDGFDGGSSASGPPGGIPSGVLGGAPAAGAARGSWTGLLGKGRVGASGGNGMPFGGYPGSNMGDGEGFGGSSGGVVRPGTGGSTTLPKAGERTLCEFVVYFIWQEPLSADGTIAASP